MKCLQVIALLMCIILVESSNITGDARVSNGNTANSRQFPFLASYQYRGLHFCGCIIVGDHWLLTAAHCVNEAIALPIKDLRIVAGITQLNTSPASMQTTTVLRQYKHPNYIGGTTPNDIGLIRTANDFKWSYDVNYILLPFADEEFYQFSRIAGWGYLRSNYPVPSPQLQYADGYIITSYECNQKVNPYGASVDYRSICTTGYNKGNETSCKGDSGGPLIFYHQNGYPLAIGIISWNLSPCGLNGSPSVSTKVSKYISWINCRVNNDMTSPSTPCY